MQHVSAPSGVAIILGRSTATIRDFRIKGPVRPPQGGVPDGGRISTVGIGAIYSTAESGVRATGDDLRAARCLDGGVRSGGVREGAPHGRAAHDDTRELVRSC